MILTFLYALIAAVRQVLPPLEVAITFGIVLFALSWVVPRRIVSLPQGGHRTTTLVWAGIAGSVFVVAVATATSWVAATTLDASGADGWWRRPAPLVAAVIVVALTGLALRRIPLPTPRERAIAPHRPWNTFVPRSLVITAIVTAAAVAVTALWQILIATTAPADGLIFGNVPAHSDLPIYMRFNSGFGYIAGAGWPNQLAMLIALVVAGIVLTAVLRADVNRPVFARSTASSVRVERERTARLIMLILLGGLVTTLGALWMHTGSIGQAKVGLDEEWISENESITHINIGSGYDALAFQMNLLGYLLQGAGVAFLLRLAVDTARAAHAVRVARRAAADIDAPAPGATGPATPLGTRP